ncbi:hypothetical protein JB92DRAFT_2535827, partial [Gautieria morchelliformis]
LIYCKGDNELTDEDLDNISVFALQLEGSGLSTSTYNNLRRFFRHKLKLDTEYLVYRRMEILSGVTPWFYDMCNKSCCLYVKRHAALTHCPHCKTLRYHTNGKPIARWSYLPLIPRIKAWYESLPMIKKLQYRSRRVTVPGEISDVFDGTVYRDLLKRLVIVDGGVSKLRHTYFTDGRDIALGASTDSF